MPTLDPFQGAAAENTDQKKGLLDVISTAGSAGKKAYEEAQAQVNTQRQNALNYAAQRQQMTGQDLGGANTAPVTESADRFGTYFGGQNAAFQNNLQAIGASGQSYLDKIQAITPFAQSQNMNQAADREQTYKTAIAQNQAKIDAQKAASAQDFQNQLKLLGIKNQYDIESDKRAQTAALAKAQADAKAQPLTKAQLLGAGQSLSDEYAGFTGMKAGSKGTFGADQTARALAAYRNNAFGDGPDSNEVNTLLGPREVPKTEPIPLPKPFDKNWLTSTFVNYDKKKISGGMADEVMKAPELQSAAQNVGELSTAKLTNGLIDDSSIPKPLQGLTPYDAFVLWTTTVPGIKTMKTALLGYYGDYLRSLR